jgi:hypothetical protein
MDSQALNPNRKVDRINHRRVVAALMAQGIEDLHVQQPHLDYGDYMNDPVYFMETDTDVRRTSAENKGGEPYRDSKYVREDVGRAFRNRRELRQKYGHIVKF